MVMGGPLAPPGPVVEVVANYVIESSIPAINKWHYKGVWTEPLSSTELNAWLAAAVSAVEAFAPSFLNAGCQLASLKMTDLISDVGLTGQTTIGLTGSGSGLAASTALVMQNHTPRRYRGGHSRTYLPCPDSSLLATLDSWNATSVNTILGDYITMQAAIAAGAPAGAGPAFHCVVHWFKGFTDVAYPSGRHHAVPNRLVPPVVDPVTTYGVNLKPANQRRRNRQSA